jgi:DnaJ family protein C protein 7
MSSPTAPTPSKNDTPMQGIKRRAPVDEPASTSKSSTSNLYQQNMRDEDDEEDYTSSDISDDSGDDSGDEDDDEEEMVKPETEEERLERALQAKERGNDLFRRGDYKLALDQYNEAVEANPSSAMYLNNRAAAHLQLGNYNKAIEDGKACVALDDNYFKGWYRLASSFLKVGNLDECKKTITQAYLRDTQQSKKVESMRTLVADVEKLISEATSLVHEKKYSQAIRTIFSCQKHVPGWSGLLSMRCEALIGTRSYPEAYALATDMLRRDPNNSDAMYWRAQALYYQGDFGKAQKHMKQVLMRDPDNKKSQQLIKKMRTLEKTKLKGNDAFKSKQWQNAINAYTECLEIDPDNSQFNAKLLCNRAAAFQHQGLYNRVIKDCNAAIYADSTYAKAFIRRGDAYVSTGGVANFETGCKDYTK